jgi:prolipoprotein diacylglyceryltransferase
MLFIILYLVYLRKRAQLKNGQLFGWFLIALFGFRFLIEYVKEAQVPFEYDLPLYMGQILSIPFVIIGIIILFTRKKAKEKTSK